jgi:hypothetical protein
MVLTCGSFGVTALAVQPTGMSVCLITAKTEKCCQKQDEGNCLHHDKLSCFWRSCPVPAALRPKLGKVKLSFYYSLHPTSPLPRNGEGVRRSRVGVGPLASNPSEIAPRPDTPSPTSPPSGRKRLNCGQNPGFSRFRFYFPFFCDFPLTSVNSVLIMFLSRLLGIRFMTVNPEGRDAGLLQTETCRLYRGLGEKPFA